MALPTTQGARPASFEGTIEVAPIDEGRGRTSFVSRLTQRLGRAARTFFFLLHNPSFAIGFFILLVLACLAVFAPLIAPFNPLATNANAVLSPPSAAHLMGTDEFGRDMLSRVIFGSRLSIFVAICAVLISSVIGSLLGLFSGFLRGVVDTIVMRSMDILLAFPGLILALICAAILGTGVRSVIIAVGVAGVPTFARVTRGAVLSVAAEDYILAARSLGARKRRIMFRHVFPNVAGPILILATLYLAYAILTAAALSFLGVGVQPPTAEWGAMVNDGRAVLSQAWWVSVFPGLMILLFVLGVNLIGEVLRDRFDVTLRARSSGFTG